LLLEVHQAAHARGTKIHMHLAQGDRETAQVERRYGQRTIAWLNGLGLLDPALLAVHLTEATTVVIDGQIVVENARLVTISEDDILDDAQRLVADIGAAAEADFWRIDSPNARAMREGNL
jgi:hypothetical protein